MQAISRLFNRCLLRPPDLPPSRDGWEVIGVFNPGAIETGEGVVLLVRVAERPAERRPGLVALPRWDMGTGQPVVDWVREDESLPVDVRVVRLKGSGLVRLNFISHLRVIRTRDGRTIDSIDDGTRFEPMTEYEEFGVEDPRITRIGDTFFFTYVAVSRHGVATALASTRDFESFERHGIMLPPENKDVALFPEKIGGKYCALHRPAGLSPFTKPEMWMSTSPDLRHWGDHKIFLSGSSDWDVGRVGAGTPPVRTPEGWLEIYHGNCRREGDPDIGVYAAGVLLLDIDDPRRILRASGAVIVPTTAFEKNGYVPNVVFPTGIVERGETALVYYGAADTCTGVVEFSLREMLNAARKI
jgi:beta-1,2-mannobiose phosphorylase / 1,2-beta-oligomannan phosphorylase